MHDIATIAALEWARTNTHHGVDPVEFGANVARAYMAAHATASHAGDEKATAAALASLSIPPAFLQALAQLSSAFLAPTEVSLESTRVGVV